METRANYIVTGAFTLAVIVGVFGFIFWFQNTAGGGERSSYRVEFVGSVSGLRTGSAVLFNGIRVGRVSGLGLDAHDPHKVGSYCFRPSRKGRSLLSRRSTAIFRARCVVPEAINTMANKTPPFDHDTIDPAPQFYSRIGLS